MEDIRQKTLDKRLMFIFFQHINLAACKVFPLGEDLGGALILKSC